MSNWICGPSETSSKGTTYYDGDDCPTCHSRKRAWRLWSVMAGHTDALGALNKSIAVEGTRILKPLVAMTLIGNPYSDQGS